MRVELCTEAPPAIRHFPEIRIVLEYHGAIVCMLLPSPGQRPKLDNRQKLRNLSLKADSLSENGRLPQHVLSILQESVLG